VVVILRRAVAVTVDLRQAAADTVARRVVALRRVVADLVARLRVVVATAARRARLLRVDLVVDLRDRASDLRADSLRRADR